MSRKNEILEAVIKLLQDGSIEQNITMSQIAKKVDIGKSTIYEYYSTKDELLTEALLVMVDNFIEYALSIEGINDMPFEEAFRTQVGRLLEVAQRSKIAIDVLSREFIKKLPVENKESMQKKMEETRDVFEKRFANMFMKATKEGVITLNEMSSPAKGMIISGVLVGTIFRYVNSEHNIPVEDVINELYHATILLANN